MSELHRHTSHVYAEGGETVPGFGVGVGGGGVGGGGVSSVLSCLPWPTRPFPLGFGL